MGVAVAAGGMTGAALAQQPAQVYYISMRGLQAELAPSYIVVVRVADAGRQTPIAGCDGRTYYATAADAATVAAARASGEVVQLHRGDQGGSPQNSRIVCIIDASGN